MLNNLDLTQILILDIETVPQFPSYDDLSDYKQKLWNKKANTLSYNKPEYTPDSIYNRAGIYAEFGKIVCISVGYFNRSGNEWTLRIKSFYGEDEKVLLKEFTELLNRHFNEPDQLLCAHNGKEFDFPYLCRRLLINHLEIPNLLNIAGKKPWEIQHIDTMELWKFGDYKNYTSLELLASVFNIPTPKDDIDGSMVWEVYWKEKDLERIKIYCQKDVVTTAQLLLSYRNERLMDEHQITYT